MVNEITDIKGVGQKTKKKIKSAGIENLNDLAQSEVEDLEEVGVSNQKASKMIKRAREANLLVQTTSERQSEYDSRETISTGIPELDEVVGGGWESENIINVYGKTGTGKTQLSFQSLVAAVEDTGRPAVYIETERNRYRPNRVRQLANNKEDVDKISTIGAYSLDDQLNAYSKVKQEFPDVSLVVVDSFNSRFRLSSEFDGRGSLSSRSEEIGKHISAIEEMAVSMECPVILTAQIYDSPSMYGKSSIVYGGNVYLHAVSYMVRLEKSTGDLISATVENHPEFRESEIHINIGESEIVGINNG